MTVTSLPAPPAAVPDSDTDERRAASARARTRQPNSSFTALSRMIHEAGLMRRRYGYYWAKLIGLTALLVGAGFAFVLIGDSWWQLALAGTLALVLVQMAFLGHDAAHRQIFKSGRWNDWVSLIIANLLVGISSGWWQGKHNKHHGNPNKEGVDPDIDLAVFALTPERIEKHRSRTMRWLAMHQGWFFFPMLLLEGLSLHSSSIRRVFGPHRIDRRWAEISLLILRLGGYLAAVLLLLPPGKAAAFLGLQVAVFGFYLGAAFAPNHIGMPLVSRRLKLDFLNRQVLTSRNVSGGRLVATLMGGLNYQIEHHLFPSMARPYLRRAQVIVAAYCADQRVRYTSMTPWQSYRSVISHLNTVGLRRNDPFLCPLVAQRRSGQCGAP
jgi:fatty acid desaturase